MRRRDDARRAALAAKIGEAETSFRRPDVDPGDEGILRVELHEGRTASAARRSGAKIRHDSAPDQVGAERTDGRRRQAGRLDDLGAGEAGRAFHREAENAIEVQRAKVAGMTRTGRCVGMIPHIVAALDCHAVRQQSTEAIRSLARQ